MNPNQTKLLKKMVVMTQFIYDSFITSYENYLQTISLKNSNVIDTVNLYSLSIFLLYTAFHSFSNSANKKEILDYFTIGSLVKKYNLDMNDESDNHQLIEITKTHSVFIQPLSKYFMEFINRNENSNPFTDYISQSIFKTDDTITKIFLDRVISVNLDTLKDYVSSDLNTIT